MLKIHYKENDNKWKKVLETCFLLNKNKDGTPHPKPKFLASQCLKKYAMEKLKTIDQAFWGEIEQLRKCASNLNFTNANENENVDITGASLAQLDHAISHCIDVKMGISTQYVYRSMYAVQLFHCYKDIPKGNLLVVQAEELRLSPKKTLAKVLKFIGLSPYQATNTFFNTTDSGIQSSMKKHFSNFERSTGWSLSGSYPPMKEDLKESLKTFFRPLNEKLFALIRQRFKGW